QERAHGGRLADADGGDVRTHILDRVVDGETRAYDAARRVDVQIDILVGILGFQIEQLGADQARDRVVDGPDQEDDALLQQQRVDIISSLAAVGLLDHHWHQRVHVRLERDLHCAARLCSVYNNFSITRSSSWRDSSWAPSPLSLSRPPPRAP